MSKCYKCEKLEGLDTRRDKIFKWICRRFFSQQLIELSEEKYGRGFGAGYKIGFNHAVENQTPITKVTPEELFPNIKEGESFQPRNVRIKKNS